MSVETAADSAAGPGIASLEEVRALGHDYNLIPLCATFIDDTHTPVSAFLKLREAGPSFLLESADQGRVGRYSFIGFRPRKVVRWSLGEPGDPYALLADELKRFRPAPVADLPPFAGGAVGVFAYDLVRTVEPLGEPNPDPVGVPDLAVMLTDTLVVFDHGGPLEAGRPGAAPDPSAAHRPGRARVHSEHDPRAVRGDGGADHRVHLCR
jgi:anthranilate synthase component 1